MCRRTRVRSNFRESSIKFAIPQGVIFHFGNSKGGFKEGGVIRKSGLFTKSNSKNINDSILRSLTSYIVKSNALTCIGQKQK